MATIIINVGTYDKIEPFADTLISVVQNDPINKNQQLSLAEQRYVDTQISTYASNTILQLSSESINEYDLAIHLSSNLIFALWNKQIQDYADDTFTIVRPYYTDQIQLYSDDQIDLYANQQIEDGYYQADFAITSTTSVSQLGLGVIFDIESLTAASAISTDAELILQIGGATLISVSSTESFENDNELLNRRFLDPNSISSTESLQNDNALLNRRFLDPNSIESTTSFGVDVLILYIGVEGTNLVSIDSTVDFPTPVFSDFVHRSLIFKDDNVTKIRGVDASEVSGGIVIESSSRVSTTSANGSYSVPTHAAGFISVIIDGVSYKMPYYNPGE